MKSLYRIFGFLSLIAAASLTLYASLFTLRTAEFAQFVVRNETLGSSHWSSEKTDELPFLSNMKISSAKVPSEGEFQEQGEESLDIEFNRDLLIYNRYPKTGTNTFMRLLKQLGRQNRFKYVQGKAYPRHLTPEEQVAFLLSVENLICLTWQSIHILHLYRIAFLFLGNIAIWKWKLKY